MDAIKEKLQEQHDKYDPKERLMSEVRDNWGGGYHTRLTGLTHPINPSVEYAAAILITKDAAHYDKAKAVLERIIELQDTKEGSPTFGLWSYYMEESLDNMIAPDYNWADFIGKNLVYILKKCSDVLGAELTEKLKITLGNAVECSLKRNVSPDYTNISLMSSMVIVSAGELLKNEKFFKRGKQRLEKLFEYTEYNGSFSEYNSSSYTLLAIEEITRMLIFFEDGRCRQIAQKLNEYAWELLAKHYSTSLKQLAPPQARAYRDLEEGQIEWFIYKGTNGRFGSEGDSSKASVACLTLPLSCPESCMKYFGDNADRWIDQTYYKKNNIRTADENTVIVRNLNSPDLRAFTYMTEEYAIGAFEKSDLWNQRRTSMIYWGKEKPCYMRIRCIKNDYDYCSGMVYTSQHKNTMLSNVGFATDRGDFHYILDKVKDGKLKAEKLCFQFEIGGASDIVEIIREKNNFIIKDDGITINLNIYEWVFNGEQGEIRLDKENKKIEMICFDGQEREIEIGRLNETYGVFSIIVNGKEAQYKKYTQENNIVSELLSENTKLSVNSPKMPAGFDYAMEKSYTEVEYETE